MLAKLSISGSIIKIFIVDLYMANRTEDPKNLLSRGMEYGGSGEMTWINHLFSNYLFIIHYKNSTNTVDYAWSHCLSYLTFWQLDIWVYFRTIHILWNHLLGNKFSDGALHCTMQGIKSMFFFFDLFQLNSPCEKVFM